MLNGILCTPPRQFAEHIAEANSRHQAESHPDDAPAEGPAGNGAPLLAALLFRLKQWKPYRRAVLPPA
jgi:hypothetical protein